jgi:hypothetical protein
MKIKKILLTAITAFYLTIILHAQVPSYVPSNGLVAWYPFNGNANDESGNGNNGINNGATLTIDRNGNANKAFAFNGTSNYIDVSDNNTLDLVSTFTISGWYNTTATSANLYTLVGKSRDNSGGTGYVLAYGIPSSTLSLNWGPNIVLNIPSTIYSSGWHFMVGTSDGSNIKIYMDSVMIQSMSTSPSLINSTSSLNIGRENSILGRYFLGKLDDIGIWNRALTQTEITKLYSSNTTSIQETIEKENFKVYPNPASNQINLRTNIRLIDANYSLTDLLGNTLLSGKISNENTSIEIENLSKGIYFLNVGGDVKQTFKIVKN